MTQFEWMVSKPSRRRAPSTLAMREEELAQRAGLLARLGYARQRTEQRLRQNAIWEHEQLGKPLYIKRLGEIVAQAYGAEPPATAGRRRRRT